MKISSFAVIATLLWPAAALAHVTVTPREASRGGVETYSFRVPTEGASATTSVELHVPLGVNIVSIGSTASEYTAERSEGRIVTITWAVNIPPEASRQLNLVARGPAVGARIQWKVRQTFADGSHVDWADEPGSRLPAPVTQLTD